MLKTEICLLPYFSKMMYSKFDSRWSKVISKDDIVSVDTNVGES